MMYGVFQTGCFTLLFLSQADADTCPFSTDILQTAYGNGVAYQADQNGRIWTGINPLGSKEHSEDFKFKDVYIPLQESSVLCYYEGKVNETLRLVLKGHASQVDDHWRPVKQADGSELLWCAADTPEACPFEYHALEKG